MRIPHEDVPHDSFLRLPVSEVLTFTIDLKVVWPSVYTSWINCCRSPESYTAVNFFLFMMQSVISCKYQRDISVDGNTAENDIEGEDYDLDPQLQRDFLDNPISRRSHVFLRTLYADNLPVGMQVFVTIPADEADLRPEVEESNIVKFTRTMEGLLSAARRRMNCGHDDDISDMTVMPSQDDSNIFDTSRKNTKKKGASYRGGRDRDICQVYRRSLIRI